MTNYGNNIDVLGEVLPYQHPRGVGRGTLVFSYIRRLAPSLVVQNFEFQYFLWFQKKGYIGGMTKWWIFWGFISNLDYFGEGHFFTFYGFS